MLLSHISIEILVLKTEDLNFLTLDENDELQVNIYRQVAEVALMNLKILVFNSALLIAICY